MIKDGKLVHPLGQSLITLGEEVIFDLSADTGRSWFVLDLALPGYIFKPKDSSYIKLADNKTLMDYCRRK